MAYLNLNGTTNKTFKIGPNGVSLASTAVIDGSNITTKYLKTNQKDGEKELYLAYTDSTDPIYDLFIKSSDITSLSYTNSTLSISLRNGNTITLFQNKGDVVGPNSSVDDSIVLFDGTSGKNIKDSETKISSTIDEESTINDKNIPTNNAVILYVGTLSEALKKRLDGKI